MLVSVVLIFFLKDPEIFSSFTFSSPRVPRPPHQEHFFGVYMIMDYNWQLRSFCFSGLVMAVSRPPPLITRGFGFPEVHVNHTKLPDLVFLHHRLYCRLLPVLSFDIARWSREPVH